MLLWNEKYATGDSLIDSQHRMLISYINQLEGLARIANPSVQDFERFLRFVEFLETYVLTHFKDEDACMNRARCPAYEENKRGHSEFLDFFREIKLRLGTEGCHPALVKKLHESCTTWVKQHVFRIDVQLIGLLGYENDALTKRTPTADAYERMAKAFDGVREVKQIIVAGKPAIFLFEMNRGNRGPAYVLWERRDAFSGEDAPPVPFDWAWAAKPPATVDALGQVVPNQVVDGRLQVKVSLTPIFIEAVE
jgi:hemerythrin-like metal-binding protein